MVIPNNGKDQKNNPPVGAALVVGAGIGGMQASLDLAEAGIKVYLLERGPAIGGVMAQLDKIFPTNDCSMCMMAPKLVEVGRHLNIELLTTAEVLGASGGPGNFTVTVRQRARYVKLDACTGCGDCVEVCPVARSDTYNAGLAQRRAIYKPYPQAIPNGFAIEKAGTAPCRDACPINQRAQGYITLIREGRFADAYRSIKEDNPFPSVCGRVCDHRCEDACPRSEESAPVNIMALKRFAADWWWSQDADFRAAQAWNTPAPETRAVSGKKVAVVGSGPAGLTCALKLARKGHTVTVFEALPVAGGMMRVGVPRFRLPPEIVQREIDDILAEGVELRLNSRIDDIPGLLNQGFNAVFVAAGARQRARPSILGADLPQVMDAAEVIRSTNLGEDHGKNQQSEMQGKKVLVLGGSNQAVDAAMVCARLGASWVGIACLESRAEMPAYDWVVREAEEEGIAFYPSRNVMEITRQNGAVSGARCARVETHGSFEGGSERVDLVLGEELIAADIIVFTEQQVSQLGELIGTAETEGEGPVVDPDTLATGIAGVFAGGDVATGAGSIIDAIAAGDRAAGAIDRYLRGEESALPSGRPPVVKLGEQDVRQRVAVDAALRAGRVEPAKRAPDDRRMDFAEISLGLSEEEARKEAARCLDCGICSECNQCVHACKADAIDHNMVDEIFDLQVGAIILTPGFQLIPGEIKPEFGYGRYPNVVTSLEFERMLSASGPYGGVVQRPSDRAHPKKVAWIQCVGSRDSRCGQGYCSSICCMYSTEEAVIAREHDPNIQPTVFYMDIRSYGKGFDAYIERAEKEQGVRYVRCMVSAVKEVPGSRDLRLSYATFDSGGRPVSHEEVFDLVILVVGLKPSPEAVETARRLGVDLNEFHFADVAHFHPAVTSRPGIYAAGAFTEPKDIPETITEASCAAGLVSADLARARGTLTRQIVVPEERDISQEEPRVGVFVCHCGTNIGGVVKIPEVVEYAQGLPDVVHVERNLYTCSQDTQEKIIRMVQEKGLNRVVVASCTIRTHEQLFQDTIRQAGLNRYLFELANLREQDSWVHRAVPGVATDKAKQLVAMAVAKARRLRPLQRGTLNVEPKALVIGGGLSGMTAALSIAAQGYAVYLVERESQLGGHLRHIYTGLDGSDPQQLLQETISRVSAEPLIHVMLDSSIMETKGHVGQFQTVVENNSGERSELMHGAVVVATGAQEILPREYGYGEIEPVITQKELEETLHSGFGPGALEFPSSVVMIQCVGSRDAQHPYCSRICCTQAMKNALEVKKLSPQTRVTILYRDLRTYGFRERYYQQARQAGVVFLQYDQQNKPVVSRGQAGLQVAVMVEPEKEILSLPASLVVLSAGIEAEPGNEALSQLLKLPLTAEGFFLEAHAKIRPVDFAADGIFLCGLAHSPRAIDESIVQAQAASMRAVELLAKKELTATPIIAEVNPRLCAACGICVDVCPYHARRLEPGMKYAEVIDVLCQGCGACVVACPNKASQQRGFDFFQISAMIDAAIEEL